MKSLIFVSIFFILNLNLLGQSNNDIPLAVLKNEKWGAINTNFDTIVPLIYDSLEVIKPSNVILVKKNYKYGLLSPTGEKITDILYNKINCKNSKYFIVKKNTLCGLLSPTGKKITEIIYSHINTNNSHYFIAKKNNKFALYNYENKQILDFKYSFINILNEKFIYVSKNKLHSLFDIGKNKFTEYYDDIINQTKYNYFFLYKNKKISLYIPEKNYKSKFFDEINIKRKNLIFFKKNSNYFVLKLDKKIKVTEPTSKLYFCETDSHYLYFINKYKSVNKETKEEKILEVDILKEIIYKKKNYKYSISNFLEKKANENFFHISKNGNYGIANSNFEIIIPMEFSKINFKNDKFYVEKDENLKGLYSKDGKILISPLYDDFFPKNNNNDLYIVCKDNKFGMLKNNKIILKIEYDDIKINRKCVVFNKNGEKGIADLNGKIKIKHFYCDFKILNDDFFTTINTENKKGIININGKEIIAPTYREIIPTNNNNIFYVASYNFELLSNNDLNRMYYKKKINKKLIKGSVKKQYYKFGLINSSREILLDTLYYNFEIEKNLNFSKNNIKIPIADSTTLVLAFEEDGQLIYKTKYKNYISVRIREEKGMWRLNKIKNKWGLFSTGGIKITDYIYDKYWKNYLGNKNLTLTAIEEQNEYPNCYGIINEKKFKVVLPAEYPVINLEDFKITSIARCFSSYGRAALITKKGELLRKCGFIGDFKKNYTRINNGGKITYFGHKQELISKNKKYTLQVPGFSYEGLSSYFSSLAFCKKGKWGVIDSMGNLIVEAKYKFLQKYFNNVFIAEKKSGKWGVISHDNSVKVNFEFDEIRHFYADTTKKTWAKIPYYKVKIKNKWGVIDSVGNIIIEAEFNEINYVYNNGIFFITKKKLKNSIFGYIDSNSYVKIKHKFYGAGEFKNGRAVIKIDRHNYNYINKCGELISEINFRKANDFSENLASVKTKGGWGFIDTTGNFIIEPKFGITGNFNNGLTFIPIRVKFFFGLIKAKTLYCFINKNKEVIIKPKFKSCRDFFNGLAVVKKDKYYGIIDTSGKFVLRPKYKEIKFDKEANNFILMNKDKEYAMINSDIEFVIPFGKYKYIGEFSEGLCVVFNDNYGYINKNGEEEIGCIYMKARSFNEGFAVVKKYEKDTGNAYYGYINKKGEKTINFIFKKAEDFKNGFAKVKFKSSPWYYIDTFGNTENYKPRLKCKKITKNIEKLLGKINDFSEGFASYEVDEVFGLYDKDGNCITQNDLIIEKATKNIFRIHNINEIKYLK